MYMGCYLLVDVLILVFLKESLYRLLIDFLHNIHLWLVFQLLCLLSLLHFILSCCNYTWLLHCNLLIWCWVPPRGNCPLPFLVSYISLPVDHGSQLCFPTRFLLEPSHCFCIQIYHQLFRLRFIHFHTHQWLGFQGLIQE